MTTITSTTSPQTRPGERLRELLAEDRLLVAPGVYDGISAAIVSRLGFSLAYMTGAGVSAAGFGLPDLGLVTQTEMAERARVIAAAVGVPLVADADTGYGSALNVARTVELLEAAGVAAVQFEDQVFPKRCGHLPGKELISAGEFERKLAVARAARRDPSLVLVARTDARGPLGLDEAIERANRYAAAGADVIFVEAPQSAAEIERIAAEVRAPLLINMAEGGLTPDTDRETLRRLGYRIAIYPGAGLLAATRAALDALGTLHGEAQPLDGPRDPVAFFELLGLARWTALGEIGEPEGETTCR